MPQSESNWIAINQYIADIQMAEKHENPKRQCHHDDEIVGGTPYTELPAK